MNFNCSLTTSDAVNLFSACNEGIKKSKDIYFALKLLTPTFATLINVKQLQRNTKGGLENFIVTDKINFFKQI